jgi:hypothetical protein
MDVSDIYNKNTKHENNIQIPKIHTTNVLNIPAFETEIFELGPLRKFWFEGVFCGC